MMEEFQQYRAKRTEEYESNKELRLALRNGGFHKILHIAAHGFKLLQIKGTLIQSIFLGLVCYCFLPTNEKRVNILNLAERIILHRYLTTECVI